MEARNGVISSAMKLWKSMNSGRKLALGMFILAGLAVLGIVSAIATRPSFAPLFSGLQQEDTAQIAMKLKELKVPYRLSGGGNTLEVPSNDVYDLRLQLAEAGLPKGGHIGFELFDGSRMGLTEFGEKINYQRALQGELERTIADLDSVESARVHLALPDDQLFAESEKKPSASVVLKLRGGKTLGRGQVRGIVNLVSSAVEGLSADEVKVLDTAGSLISAPVSEEAAGDGMMLTRLQMKREFERQTEQKVQSMLDETAGQGKTVVRIAADIDFDAKELEESIYSPDAENHGVLESQQETHETYNGGGVPLARGIPGVASNTGARPVKPAAAAGADSYERTETNAKYQVSKRVQHSKIGPGQVKKLHLALFVDESVDPDGVKSLEKVASAAAGIDAKREDEVAVERTTFAKADDKQEKVTVAGKAKEFYFSGGKDVIAGILMLVFLMFVRSLFKSSQTVVTTERRPGIIHASVPTAETAAAQPVAGLSKGPTNGESILANVDSEKMAQAIRSLMAEAEEA